MADSNQRGRTSRRPFPFCLLNILAGITRKTVIEIAEARGYEVRVERFLRDGMLLADEVFLTGRAAEVTPVGEVDGRVIGTGTRGTVTEEIQGAYFGVVKGEILAPPEWLTRTNVGEPLAAPFPFAS